MSLFTKRRKIVRQKQEANRKHWDEMAEKSNEGLNKILKTTEYIEKNHPEFDSLDEEDRVKLFAKIYNEINNSENE